MSLALGFAAAGQALAETLMSDTVRVLRNLPLGTPDTATGVVTPAQTTIYTGPARIKPLKRVTAGGVTAGEAFDSESVYIVSLPIAVTTVRPGDIVQATASADADVLTNTYRVIIVEHSPQITARRLTCELVDARAR